MLSVSADDLFCSKAIDLASSACIHWMQRNAPGMPVDRFSSKLAQDWVVPTAIRGGSKLFKDPVKNAIFLS